MEAANLVVEAMWGRERPADQLAALFAGGWPAFIEADEVAADHLPRVRRLFSDWELALLDPATDELVAAGWAVPLRWDGTAGSLPAGYSDSLGRALADHDAGVQADTAVVCAVQVRHDLARTGIATRVLRALVQLAAERGVTRVIAPLRPTAKHLDPDMPIERYAAWTRSDGTAHDAWLRTHLAMGGTILGTSPASQIFVAPLSSWEEWSGQAMPDSGSYLIPEAIAPVEVDVASGIGTLTEPCIWVQHQSTTC